MPSWDWVQCIYCSCHCAQILLLGIIVIWSFHFKSTILKIYFIYVSEAVENLRKCNIRACRWDEQVYKDCFNWTTRPMAYSDHSWCCSFPLVVLANWSASCQLGFFFKIMLCPSIGPEKPHWGSGQFNKLTSVFHASLLLLIMNFVITLSK